MFETELRISLPLRRKVIHCFEALQSDRRSRIIWFRSGHRSGFVNLFTIQIGTSGSRFEWFVWFRSGLRSGFVNYFFWFSSEHGLRIICFRSELLVRESFCELNDSWPCVWGVGFVNLLIQFRARIANHLI